MNVDKLGTEVQDTAKKLEKQGRALSIVTAITAVALMVASSTGIIRCIGEESGILRALSSITVALPFIGLAIMLKLHKGVEDTNYGGR